ncbi:hypothetical protein [Streptomyces sp. NPDC058045]
MTLNLARTAADPGDQDGNTDFEDGDGEGGNPSPGHWAPLMPSAPVVR